MLFTCRAPPSQQTVFAQSECAVYLDAERVGTATQFGAGKSTACLMLDTGKWYSLQFTHISLDSVSQSGAGQVSLGSSGFSLTLSRVPVSVYAQWKQSLLCQHLLFKLPSLNVHSNMVSCLEVLPPWPLRSAAQAGNANTNELRRRASLSASVSTPSSTVPTHPPVNHPSAPPNIKPVPATAPATTPTTVTPAAATSITTNASSSIIPTPIPAHLALGASPTPLPVKPPTAPIPQFDLNNNIRTSQTVSNEEPSTPSSSQSLMEPSIGNMATSTPPPTQPAPVPINAPSSSRKRSRASFAEPAITAGDAVAEESLPTSARKKERTASSKVTFTAIGSSSSPQATNLKRKDRKKATSSGVAAVGSSAASPAGIESLQPSASVATFPASDSNLGDVPQSSASASNIVGDESDGRVSERTLSMDPATQAGLSASDFPKNDVSEKSGAPSIDSPQIPQSLGLESNPSHLIPSDNAQEPSGTSEATVWTMTKPSSDFAASSNEPFSVSNTLPAKETKAEALQFVVATSGVYIKTSSIPISSVLESPISNEPPTKIPEPIPAPQYVPTTTDTVVETSTHISALLSHQSIDIPNSASRSFAADEVRSSALNVINETMPVQPGNELSSKYAAEGGEDIVMQESGVSSGEVEAGEIRESDQDEFIDTQINFSDPQKSSENASAVVSQSTNNGTNDMDIDEQPSVALTVETSSVAARRDIVPQELPAAENLDLKGADNSGNQDNIGRGTSDFAPPSSTLASDESHLPVNASLVIVDANRINGESTSESGVRLNLPLDTEGPSVPFATNETSNHLVAVETDASAGLTDPNATAFGVDQSAADFAPPVTASISNPPLINYNPQDPSVISLVTGKPNVGYSLEQRSQTSIPTAASANDGGVNTLETSSLMQGVSNTMFENTSGLNHTFATPDNAVLEKEASEIALSEVAKNPEAGSVSEDNTAVAFQPASKGESLLTGPAKPLADIFGAASIALLNPSKDELEGNSESSREPIPKKPSNPLDHVKVALQLIQKESVLLVGTAELPTTQPPILAPTQSTYHSSLIDTEPVLMSDVMAAQPIAQEAELEEGEMAPTPSIAAPLAQQQFEAGAPQQVTGRSGRRGSVKGAKALLSALSSSSSAASLQADLSDGEVVATEEEALVDKKKCAYCQTSVTPMWRRGPGGAGTLCNACGMKWAKKKM